MPRKTHKGREQKSSLFTPERLIKPKIRCRCGKVYSPTEADARRAEHAVQREKGKQNPVRFYECKFGSWHWTRSLYEVRQCRSCLGTFRPKNDEPDTDLCGTCADILAREPEPRLSRPAGGITPAIVARLRGAA